MSHSRIGVQQPARVDPRHVRKLSLEQDGVRGELTRALEYLRARVHLSHRVLIAAEQGRKRVLRGSRDQDDGRCAGGGHRIVWPPCNERAARAQHGEPQVRARAAPF